MTMQFVTMNGGGGGNGGRTGLHAARSRGQIGSHCQCVCLDDRVWLAGR